MSVSTMRRVFLAWSGFCMALCAGMCMVRHDWALFGVDSLLSVPCIFSLVRVRSTSCKHGVSLSRMRCLSCADVNKNARS